MALGKLRAIMVWWQLNLACGSLVTPALESTMIEHMHISIGHLNGIKVRLSQGNCAYLGHWQAKLIFRQKTLRSPNGVVFAAPKKLY